MDQLFSHHVFVDKPFYKWFRKCTECNKRNIWNPMAKCSGCKNYRHRRCMQPDDDVCIRPVEDARTLSLAASDVPAVEEIAENFALASCGENAELLVIQRQNATDDCESGADTGPQGQISEATDELFITVKVLPNAAQVVEIPSAGVVTFDECTTGEMPSADEPTSSSSIHRPTSCISMEKREVAERFRHEFINKPFYKLFHKCAKCDKRKIWNPIAKCSGCKTYWHRRCIQADDDDDECCRPKPTESTVQELVQELEEDVRDRSLADITFAVVDEHAESITAGKSCEESSTLVVQKQNVMDDGDIGADTGLPDHIFSEATGDESMPGVGQDAQSAIPRSANEIMSVACCTSMLAKKGTQAVDKSKYLHRPLLHISEFCWMNVEFPRSCWPTRYSYMIHTNPTESGSAFNLVPYGLPSAGTETGECRKDDDGVESGDPNKSYDDGDLQDIVPEEKKLD